MKFDVNYKLLTQLIVCENDFELKKRFLLEHLLESLIQESLWAVAGFQV